MSLQNAKFIVTDGPQIGQQFSLEHLPIIFGRTHEADAVIPHDSISRRHAKVEVSGEGATICDMGSKNGVEVNGIKVQGAVALFDGDRIAIGKVKLKCIMPTNLRPGVPQPTKEEMKSRKVAEKRAQQAAIMERSTSFLGGNSNIVLATVLGIGIVLAVLALILVSDGSDDPPEIYTLKVGEELLVPTKVITANYDMVIENKRVVRARPDKGSRKFVIWFEGLGLGDSLVVLKNKEGEVHSRYKIVVRGRSRDYENELGIMDMDSDERMRQSRTLVRTAEALKRDQLLNAIYTYDKALAVAKNLEGAEEFYLESQEKRQKLVEQFEQLFKDLGNEYVLASQNGNKKGQIEALNKIMALVPDATHPYNQRARYARQQLTAKN